MQIRVSGEIGEQLAEALHAFRYTSGNPVADWDDLFTVIFRVLQSHMSDADIAAAAEKWEKVAESNRLPLP